MALDLEPGDEVIAPAFTFFATAGTIHNAGGTPVFVDIEPGTFNLDPAAVEAAITPRTRAIMPVHLYGQMAALERLQVRSEEHTSELQSRFELVCRLLLSKNKLEPSPAHSTTPSSRRRRSGIGSFSLRRASSRPAATSICSVRMQCKLW